MSTLNLTGPRAQLLYVTNRRALESKNGDSTAVTAFFNDLRSLGVRVLDIASADPAAIAAQIYAHSDGVLGVVILGGYDVIPAQRVSCIPKGNRTNPREDSDNFIVWSDDVYGYAGADGVPTIPVSRIPDCVLPLELGGDPRDPTGTLASLGRGLSVAAIGGGPAYALVNRTRSFGDSVYTVMCAQGSQGNVLEHSMPTNVTAQSSSRPAWEGQHAAVYLMLHCLEQDGAVFKGEAFDLVDARQARGVANPQIVALGTEEARVASGCVVLAGCCWGGLISDDTAVQPRPGDLRTRGPERSIAMMALVSGAVAFVGNTGLSLSPVPENSADGSDDYYDKPLHIAFWKAFRAGASPARALMNAKREYLAGIPHRGAAVRDSDLQIAQEIKELRQMTCLGIGW